MHFSAESVYAFRVPSIAAQGVTGLRSCLCAPGIFRTLCINAQGQLPDASLNFLH